MHLDLPALEAALPQLRQSPSDHGVVDLIGSRPAVDQREVLSGARLDVAVGLVGDSWQDRGTPDP